MTILGIDPGLARTGYAVLETKNNKIKTIVYGCFVTQAKSPLERRLLQIYSDITKIIKKHKPEKMAIEQLFFGKNVKSALLVGQARGLAFLAAAQGKIPIYEFTPPQIKQGLTDYGNADKSQIQKMLKIILNLKNVPTPDDAADALAIAYCCLQARSFA